MDNAEPDGYLRYFPDGNRLTLKGARYLDAHHPDWQPLREARYQASQRTPAVAAPETAEPALAGCMRLALQRAEAWLWWHAARAAARGLANGSDGLVRAASAFQDMVGRLDRSDAVPVSLGWLAARVFDAVRSQAADDAAKGGKTDSSFDQYLDLTSDGLRGAVHVIGSIARYASMMRAGHIDHLDAANCAVSDIVNLPAIPEQLDFLQ